jgi:hypothetical protein
MNRKLAVKVVEEVVNAIKDSAEVEGYEFHLQNRRSKDVAEIVVLATLNRESRREVKVVLSVYGLELTEAKGRVTIRMPSEKTNIYL